MTHLILNSFYFCSSRLIFKKPILVRFFLFVVVFVFGSFQKKKICSIQNSIRNIVAKYRLKRKKQTSKTMAEFSSSNVKNSELVLGSPNNNNNNNSNSECDSIFRNQSMARRKFEKFRTKLVELFFTTTTTTTSINVVPKSPSSSLVNTSQNNNDLSNDDESSLSLKNHKQQQSKRRKSSSSTSGNCIEPASNTMLISNCYYGYKTIQMGNESGEEFVSNMNRKTSKKTKGTTSKHSINTYVTQSFSSSTDSSSTSSITDENESNSCSSYRNSSKHTGEANFSPCQVANSNSMSGSFHKPSGMIMIDSNYDSFSMNTNSFDFYQNETHCASSPIEAAQNPFLNASLTDLISFNSELSLLESFFEASLHLIDGNCLIDFKILSAKAANGTTEYI